jgi:hypothetical protein
MTELEQVERLILAVQEDLMNMSASDGVNVKLQVLMLTKALETIESLKTPETTNNGG